MVIALCIAMLLAGFTLATVSLYVAYAIGCTAGSEAEQIKMARDMSAIGAKVVYQEPPEPAKKPKEKK